MPNLESLLNDLANLDAQHDLEGLRKELLDKLGLDLVPGEEPVEMLVVAKAQ